MVGLGHVSCCQAIVDNASELTRTVCAGQVASNVGVLDTTWSGALCHAFGKFCGCANACRRVIWAVVRSIWFFQSVDTIRLRQVISMRDLVVYNQWRLEHSQYRR